MTHDAEKYILTLEDDPMMRCVIDGAIGIKSLHFESGADLSITADSLRPCAVFIDIHLKGSISGLELIPKLRSLWRYIPIIVITADTNAELVGEALAAGADDFVRKPLHPKELLARFQARSNQHEKLLQSHVKTVGDIKIDNLHNAIIGHRAERIISRSEMTLLQLLAQAQGTIVLRKEIKLRCWGKVSVSDKALDRRVHLLRTALADVSETMHLRAVYGTGFKLEAAEPFGA